MAAEVKKEIELEIGHVLFIDIVGYSKLLNEEQKERLNQLTEIVLATTPVRQATDEQLVRLPTGDGMALVFWRSAEEPARCALEIAEALRKHPELPVRMGIHSGPVSEVTDVSGRTNIAGAGINMAQRVMDCGDAGHILLSQHVADDLVHSRQWASRLRDLGECQVKHGVRLHLVNLYAEPLGNAALPQKFQQAKPKSLPRNNAGRIAEFAAIAVLMAGAAYYFVAHRAPKNTAISENSIAVLPFVDMSQAKDQGYFSDGISEELLNLLAKIPQLKVAARTSSFSFKGKGVEIPEIARQLHVANVLEGSVRRSGDQVRITAQLIRAAEGYHLWSETYDRKMDDIFKIQDEIAGEVVKELKLKLLAAAPKVRTTDPQAYALYLQAVELGRQFNAEAFTKSDALYRQVLEIDPRYAPAWIELASNFINKANMGSLSSREGYTHAREAAEKALEIDPDYAPAHTDLGWVAMYGDNDPAAAGRHYQQALALDSTDVRVLADAATFLQNLGRLDEALALEETVARRDSVNVTTLFNLGYFQRVAGRYDAAIASLRTLLSLSPSRGGAHAQLGKVLMLKGDMTGSLAEIEQEKSEGDRMTGLPMAYCALGRKADADADKAFEWLDKAVGYQDGGLAEIATENLFDKIHSDPRWLPFVRKIGKAP